MASITRRGGSYSIRCSAGYDITGKQIIRSMTWHVPDGMGEKKAEREARHQAALFEEKVRRGETPDGVIKFKDFAEQWFTDYADIQLRKRTVRSYRDCMVRINQEIGHIRIDRLKPQHLIRFYDKLSQPITDQKYKCIINFKDLLKKEKLTQAECAKKCTVSAYVIRCIINDGKAINAENARKISKALKISQKELFEETITKKTLSDKTRRNYHALISSILSWAVKWQVIPSSPAERVSPPKVSGKEAAYLDDRSALDLLKALEGEPVKERTAIELLLYTGMRRGELLGLKWDDIDFKKKIISIRRSTLYLPGQGVFSDETKTKSSTRTLKVSDTVLTPLREYKAWQGAERLSMGSAWHDEGWVFTTYDGHAMRPDHLTRWFKQFIKQKGLPEVHLHSLRHTNATLLIASGTNLQTVAGRLGHANASTTTKIYSHAVQSAEAAAVEALDCLLDKTRLSSK